MFEKFVSECHNYYIMRLFAAILGDLRINLWPKLRLNFSTTKAFTAMIVQTLNVGNININAGYLWFDL